MKNKMLVRGLFSLLSVLATAPVFAQDAIVVEKQETMDTYPFSDPNPVATPDNLCYPYFRYDGFAKDKVKKEWKTVQMENPYIKVTLFPEIGGKVWGAVDKTSGKEFIYHNHVVKFRDIAMRGAWVSGGIEFNFGIIGHVPTSATPVDYLVKKKEDGSVSCYISSFELLTRTYWTVEVNLPKDKAYFTTHTTWFNASSLDQPYYHWMNAGYKASPEMEFCYPGNSYIGHGGELYSFPKDQEGHDLSWFKGNAFGGSKSYHVLGYYNDSYGAYWHEDDFGSGHYSAYDEKLGMKIFLWSQARDGAIWEDLLTDTDGQYVELQSGKMYNQPATASARTTFKHAFFRPGATDVWTEYWFPMKGTKGFVKGSPIGALNVKREGKDAVVYFSPLQDLNTTVKVEAAGKIVYDKSVAFKTLETWTHRFAASELPVGASLKVTIGDRELCYSEAVEDKALSRPKEMPADFDWNSVYGLYVKGEQWLYQKYYLQAEKELKAALDKDPYFIPALVRLASLYYRWGRYEAALNLTRTVLSLNAYDGEANYLYGLCNVRLKKYVDAKDGFSVAAYDPAFRSAAYTGLAGMMVREKDYRKAISFAEKSLLMNVRNLDAQQIRMLCYRYLGEQEKARELQREVLANLPLTHLVRYEHYLLNPTDASREEFASLIRNELPAQTYMELALWYESVGCLTEAIDLLSFVEEPVSLYKKAWLLDQLGKTEEAAQTIEKADLVSVAWAFPFRGENKSALQWACQQTQSWKPVYLQALLLHANGEKEKALSLVESCSNVDFNPFYLYRASLKKGTAAYEDLKKAERLDQNWRTGNALIRYYNAQKEYVKANQTAERYYKAFPDNYVLGLQYGTSLCQVGAYRKSAALLKRIQVLPNEGAYAGRAIYRKANLFEAIDLYRGHKMKKALQYIASSKEWIENLGVGEPYADQIDYRFENYLEAQVQKSLNPKQAEELLAKVAQQPSRLDANFNSAYLLVAMAMKQQGREQEAEQWMQRLKEKYADNQLLKWSLAIYQGDKQTADQLLESRTDQSAATPWEYVYIDHNFDLIVQLFK